MKKFNVKFLILFILFFNNSLALEFKTKVDVSDINNISIEQGNITQPTTTKEEERKEKEVEVKEVTQKTKTNTEIKEKINTPSPSIKKEEPKKEIINKEPVSFSEPVPITEDDNNYLKNIVTMNQEVLTTYWKSNVFTIPNWKYDILEEFNLSDDEKLVYIVINNIECGKEDWFCLSWGKWNVWPFQINYIHTDSYWHSRKLIDEWKKEELYRYQLGWTIERTNRGKNWVCKNTYGDSLLKCLLKFHNWNNTEVSEWVKFKDIYASKWVEFKKLILKHSLDL